MIAIAAICLLAIHLSPAKEYLRNLHRLKDTIQAAGIWGLLAVMLGMTVLSAVGMSRLALAFAAGLLYGFTGGLFLSLTSSLAGSYGTFVFARWSGQEWVIEHIPKKGKLDFFLRKQSWKTVFLARQLPIANIIVNMALSLTHVPHSTFLIGSTAGFLPGAMVAVLTGSSLGKSSPLLSMIQLGFALVVVAVMAGAIWEIRRTWKDQARDNPEPALSNATASSESE
jgi:uncharacterized membrane protein YdjX (TVP38/TMEM64 family)